MHSSKYRYAVGQCNSGIAALKLAGIRTVTISTFLVSGRICLQSDSDRGSSNFCPSVL